MHLQSAQFNEQVSAANAHLAKRIGGIGDIFALKQLAAACGVVSLQAALDRDPGSYRIAGRAIEDLNDLMRRDHVGAFRVDPNTVASIVAPVMQRLGDEDARRSAALPSSARVTTPSEGDEYVAEIAAILAASAPLAPRDCGCAYLDVALVACHAGANAAWLGRDRELALATLLSELALRAASAANAADAPTAEMRALGDAFERLGAAMRPTIEIVNQVDVPAPLVRVALPARRTETRIARDADGNLVSASQLETDA